MRFDDSSQPDLDLALPTTSIPAGQSVRIGENPATADIATNAPIFFSSTRGGAVLLCTSGCATTADVIDAVAFSEGEPHPPLPAGLTFSPAGLSGIVDEAVQVYARTAFAGQAPAFVAADWVVQ